MSVTTIMLRDVVKLTNDHIGLDDYPIFDEAYRKTLNDRIKKTYWLQEIAHETIDIFIWRLSLKMELIMPRYNRMYLAELQNTDPFEGNRHHSETSQDGRSQNSGINHQTGSGSGTNKSKGRTVGSDTPQTRLAGDGDYATSISDASTSGDTTSRNESDSTSSSSSNYVNNQHSNSWGYSGSKARAIADYRGTLLNVDDLVIAELSDLFMGLWDTDMPHTPGGLINGYSFGLGLGGYYGYW